MPRKVSDAGETRIEGFVAVFKADGEICDFSIHETEADALVSNASHKVVACPATLIVRIPRRENVRQS